MGKKYNTRYLYTVWRNSDDMLMILDGTAEDCAEVMKITRAFFYKLMCVKNGVSEKWTIEKKSIAEIEAEIAEETIDD